MLGGQVWQQARADAEQRAGHTFSLKEFHSTALSLGSMGLDPLREALARVMFRSADTLAVAGAPRVGGDLEACG